MSFAADGSRPGQAYQASQRREMLISAGRTQVAHRLRLTQTPSLSNRYAPARPLTTVTNKGALGTVPRGTPSTPSGGGQALSEATLALQSLSAEFQAQNNGYMEAKSREMLRGRGPNATKRGPPSSAQKAKIEKMAVELKKKGERLKDAKMAVEREKRAADAAKKEALSMRREIEVIVGDLHNEKLKAQQLKQTNERLQWKLEHAERLAGMSPAPSTVRQQHSSSTTQHQPGMVTPASSSSMPQAHGVPPSASFRQPALAAAAGAAATPASKRKQPKPQVVSKLDLHQACAGTELKKVERLLKLKDADGQLRWPVNGLNKERETPLHWAASRGHTKIVRLLLKHKADPTLKDKWGQTAAEQALNKGHYAVSDLLEDEEEDLLESAQEEEAVAMARAQLEGQPPLHRSGTAYPSQSARAAAAAQEPTLPEAAAAEAAFGAAERGGRQEAMLVHVSHNLEGESLQLSLPRQTSYDGLLRFLLDALAAPTNGALTWQSEDVIAELLYHTTRVRPRSLSPPYPSPPVLLTRLTMHLTRRIEWNRIRVFVLSDRHEIASE